MVVVGAIGLWWGAEWQQDVRQLMEMEQLEVFEGGHLFLVQDRSAFRRIVDFLGEAGRG